MDSTELINSELKYLDRWLKSNKINKQTNNNDLLENDGGTQNCIYND